METYQNYKGYGIRYVSWTGTTTVYDGFLDIAIFKGCGEMKGLELAKKLIDKREPD